MAVSLLIYDDNEALLQSLQSLLLHEPDFVVAGMMSNAETVEADLEAFRPDIVIMDIDMPLVNGVEAVRRIRKKDANVSILMLTVFDDNHSILEAICAGASGYLLKQNAATDLVAALRLLLAGGAPMTGSVARKVLHMLPAMAGRLSPAQMLTRREVEILEALVQGKSYKMMAAEMGISVDGVRFHIKKIYQKLQVHSASGAVAKALRDKLL